jgi:TolB-like protein/DNA-binding winged helix-turn-helix (wHTH) protein
MARSVLFTNKKTVNHHIIAGVEMDTTETELRNDFAIGAILVEPNRNILSHGTDVFVLEPKIMDVLQYLANHQGKVCSRDDIISEVWKVQYGADESLTRAISVIRKTLKKAGGESKYIQTISKRGYLLQEPVTKLHELNAKPQSFVDNSYFQTSSESENEVLKSSSIERIDQTISEISDYSVGVKKIRAKTLGLAFAILIGITSFFLVWQWLQSIGEFGNELPVSPHGRSVAVMPFVDISEGKNHKYFSDGISEEISNELRKINALRIVGQRLGAAPDYINMSYEEIGEKLRVSHIIHGSVRTHQERVRITAQLINTVDYSQVWSSNYDGTLDDIFELQNHVASDIVLELSLILSLDISETINIGKAIPMSSGSN